MFSPAFGRVTRSAHSLATTPASCLFRTTRTPAAPHPPVVRPGHQRRLSSSKPASSPPSNKKKAAAAAAAAALEENAPGAARRASGQEKKRRGSSTTFAGHNVPKVSATDHLDEAQIKLASFFGQHLPMSISHPQPYQAPLAQFNALFDPAPPAEVQQVQDVDRVLSSYMQRVSEEISVEDERSAHMVHSELAGLPLDSQPGNYYLPFVPPPPPRPFDALAHAEPETDAYDANNLAATIDALVTEVPLPRSYADRSTQFRRHVARRRSRNGMLLISVKRQRKLKMKKHKYKKLMKRTRLERRKLDKL